MQEGLKKEISFRTSRSSGAGGQHVNKVSTRVELLFDVEGSSVLSEEEKVIIKDKLTARISKDGILTVACEETRSQSRNKEIAFEKFTGLIEDALKPLKKRVPTKRSKGSIEKRLKDKKAVSDKKDARKFKDE
ncbi:MAG: aminoacyl-tRNA hydrolase [Bacteroidetes bacterium]|nr:MAG: aminoacyl-tRNA hydrolase [Bacteroidota bacterium]